MNKNLENKNKIARWMDDSLTEQEKEELKDIEELESLKVVVDSVAQWKLPPLDIDKGLERLKRKQFQNKRKKISIWLGAAASVLLIFSSVLWFHYFNTKVTVTTTIAEQKTLVLPKGSEIIIDAVSSIEYDSKDWELRRKVHLNGQAYFKVTKGSQFEVHVSQGIVSVLGTEFNIKSISDKFLVACYEGEVAVKFQDQEVILKKGEKLTLVNEESVKSKLNDGLPAWIEGVSVYKEVRLPEILEDLKKYYEVTFILPSVYDELRFTGKLPHDNLELALKNLLVPLELKYKENKDGAIVVY